MALIQPYMAVKCRTPEEVAIFEEIAHAEGHLAYHKRIEPSGKEQRLYVTNYSNMFNYPDDVGYTDNPDYIDGYPGDCKIIVEAKDLFHNQLISRRKKHERSMDK